MVKIKDRFWEAQTEHENGAFASDDLQRATQLEKRLLAAAGVLGNEPALE